MGDVAPTYAYGEWYVVRCASKNRHQNTCCPKRLDYMLRNLPIIIVNTIGGGGENGDLMFIIE